LKAKGRLFEQEGPKKAKKAASVVSTPGISTIGD